MSLYDCIGGAKTIAIVVEDLYDRVLADPSLAPAFMDLDIERIKGHQRTYLAAVLGGPLEYTGRGMAQAHATHAVDDADFDMMVAHLVDTLATLGVPDQTIGEIGAILIPLRKQIVTVHAAHGAP